MFFGRQPVTRGARWLESIVITVSAPILGSLVVPADPYLLRAPFPWLALAPVFVALQHGVWAGLFSSMLLCGGAVWHSLSNGALPASFASWGIGCVVLAAIAGQFRDSLRAKVALNEQRAEDLQDRLERSERTRHVIQLSHAKLAERVAASRSSLVAAVEGAQLRMAEASNIHDLAGVMLEVLASQGNLHAASLYLTDESSALRAHPLASFGGTGESSARHPLVQRAFTTGKLAAIVDAVDPNVLDKSVLVAVPLITSQRQILGVVAVHQMPFMSFQADHLNHVFVLAGHISDMLFDRSRALYSELERPTEIAELREHGLPELPEAVVPAPSSERASEQPAVILPEPALEVEAALPEPELDVQPEPIATETVIPEPEEVPDPMEDDATISIEVETPSAPVERPRARITAPTIELPPPRAARKHAAPKQPVAPAVIARVETKTVRVPAPVMPSHPEKNPLKRTMSLLVPERASVPAPAPVAKSEAPSMPAAKSTPAPATTHTASPSEPPRTIEASGLLRVRVPPAPKPQAKREDVTETRLVQRPRYEIRSKHVTRTFPAVKLPKPGTESQPEASSERPRAQASIRSQVAEAASRNCGSR